MERSPIRIPLSVRNENIQLSSEFIPQKTPKKTDIGNKSAPITPSSNWKILTSVAASLDYAENKIKKSPSHSDKENMKSSRNIFVPRSQTPNINYQELKESPLILKERSKSSQSITESKPSRKEKSLGLLCQRFLALYPSTIDDENQILVCLDEVVQILEVERRRIYDIVNVLESVNIVSRVAKNRYKWLGMANLKQTLSKLKVQAIIEKLPQKVKLLEESSNSNTCEFTKWGSQDFVQEKDEKIQKSLTAMSKRFLMLFLIFDNALNLDWCAKVILGTGSIANNQLGNVKTKVRRLYDIANIFTSLKLIEKVHVAQANGRKPAFQYIGPKVETTSAFDSSLNQRTGDIKLKMPRTKSESILDDSKKNSSKSFVRHPSLHDICTVAEMERNRLNSNFSSPISGIDSSPGSVFSTQTTPSTSPRIESTIMLPIGLNSFPQISPNGGYILAVPLTNPVKTPISFISSPDISKFTISNGKIHSNSQISTPQLLCNEGSIDSCISNDSFDSLSTHTSKNEVVPVNFHSPGIADQLRHPISPLDSDSNSISPINLIEIKNPHKKKCIKRLLKKTEPPKKRFVPSPEETSCNSLEVEQILSTNESIKSRMIRPTPIMPKSIKPKPINKFNNNFSNSISVNGLSKQTLGVASSSFVPMFNSNS